MIRILIVALALLGALTRADAASATFYIDTGGCQSGSSTRCSGTTDSATATASGAAATITCSATSGPASAPGCSLSGSPNLSGVATDGSQAIYVNCATNSGQKIFIINAIDDGADLVGTTATPTGCTAATSDWGIGGRLIWASGGGSDNLQPAARSGDTIHFNNTPATRTANYFSGIGASATAAGFVTVEGPSGCTFGSTCPVLETTNASRIGTLSNSYIRFRNLEFKVGGATQAFSVSGVATVFDRIKISAGSGGGITATTAIKLLNSEITGLTGTAAVIAAATSAASGHIISGNYLHDNTTTGAVIDIGTTGGNAVINRNIIDSNAGVAISLSGAPTTNANSIVVTGNVIYGNGADGLLVSDADWIVYLYNNIFLDNGNTGTEYNVNWSAGAAENIGQHGSNIFSTAGGAGGGNVNGLTANATESTSDPQFSNAASANFAIGNASPGAGAGTPNNWLGSATTGYLDIGVAQRQSGGTAGMVICGWVPSVRIASLCGPR